MKNELNIDFNSLNDIKLDVETDTSGNELDFNNESSSDTSSEARMYYMIGNLNISRSKLFTKVVAYSCMIIGFILLFSVLFVIYVSIMYAF